MINCAVCFLCSGFDMQIDGQAVLLQSILIYMGRGVRSQNNEHGSSETEPRPTTLVALLVLQCLSFLLAITFLILMIVYGFMRFGNDTSNLPIQLAGNCQDAYSNLRFTAAQPSILSISFSLSCFKVAMALVLFIIFAKSLFSNISDENPLLLDTFFRYMGRKSLIAAYIFQSMSLMAVACIFGHFLSFTLDLNRLCSYNYNQIVIIALAAIGGVMLLFDILILIIIIRKLIVLRELHYSLESDEELDISRRNQEQQKIRSHQKYMQNKQYADNSTHERNNTIENLVTNKREEYYRKKFESPETRNNPIFNEQQHFQQSPYDKVRRPEIYQQDDVRPSSSAIRQPQVFSPKGKERLPGQQKQSKIDFNNLPYDKTPEQNSYRQTLHRQQPDINTNPYEPLKATLQRKKSQQIQLQHRQSPPTNAGQRSEKKEEAFCRTTSNKSSQIDSQNQRQYSEFIN